jgi:uncharacterized protein (TIGR01777 family)
MKILIPGGTGQIGRILRRHLHAEGHEIVVLSRSDRADGSPGRMVRWDLLGSGAWTAEFNGADVVVNLAGRSVNCRYTPANRSAILQSRVQSTEAIAQAISRADRPPTLWLQSSTATLYGHRFDAPNDETSGWIHRNAPGYRASWDFSVQVAEAWETAVSRHPTPHTRKVLLRSAMTMSCDRGGVFDVLLGLVRKGLGGTNGSGRQFVSWIHEQDFVNALRWILAHDHLEGPVNLAAPVPLPNRDFMRALRHAWGVPLGLPATEWMLEIGALFLRTETELILKSRRVVPGRLLESGFTFEYPDWPTAAAELCTRFRNAERNGR